MRFLKKVASRGALTLPSDIREAMDIEEGDIIEFSIIGIVRKHEPRAPEATLNQTPGTTA